MTRLCGGQLRSGVVAEQVSNIPGLGSFNRLDFGGGVIGDAAAKLRPFASQISTMSPRWKTPVNLDDAGSQETAIFFFRARAARHRRLIYRGY